MLQRLHLAHSPDSNFFALATGSQTIRVWDAPERTYHTGEAAAQEPYALEFDTGALGILHLQFVSDAHMLCVHENGTVQLWALQVPGAPDPVLHPTFSSRESATFEQYGIDRHLEKVSDTLCALLCWSLVLPRLGAAASWTTTHDPAEPGCARVGLGGVSGEMLWLDISADEVHLQKLGTLPSGISLISISPQGTRVATASRDRRVTIWRPTEDLPVHQDTGAWRIFPESGGEIWALAFSHCGRFLAGGGIDNGVYLWDLRAKRALRAVSRDHKGWISDVAWSQDDRVLACASWDNTVGLFRGKDLMPLFCFELHSDYVSQVLFATGSSSLISAGYDHQLAIWDWRSAQLLHQEKAHDDWVQSLCWLGNDLFASASSDQQICVWSLRTKKQETVFGDRPALDWRLRGSLSPYDSLLSTDSGGFTTVRPGTRQDVLSQLAERAMAAASEPGLDSEVSVFFDDIPNSIDSSRALDQEEEETQEAPMLAAYAPQEEERETQEFPFGTSEGPELSEEFSEEFEEAAAPAPSGLSGSASAAVRALLEGALDDEAAKNGAGGLARESSFARTNYPSPIPMPSSASLVDSEVSDSWSEHRAAHEESTPHNTEIFPHAFSSQERSQPIQFTLASLAESSSAPSVVSFLPEEHLDDPEDADESLSMQGAPLSPARLRPDESFRAPGTPRPPRLLDAVRQVAATHLLASPTPEVARPQDSHGEAQRSAEIAPTRSGFDGDLELDPSQTQGPWLRSLSWAEPPSDTTSTPELQPLAPAQEPMSHDQVSTSQIPEQEGKEEKEDPAPSAAASVGPMEQERDVVERFNWAQVVSGQDSSSAAHLGTSERVQHYKQATQESIDAFFDDMMLSHNIPMASFAEDSEDALEPAADSSPAKTHDRFAQAKKLLGDDPRPLEPSPGTEATLKASAEQVSASESGRQEEEASSPAIASSTLETHKPFGQDDPSVSHLDAQMDFEPEESKDPAHAEDDALDASQDQAGEKDLSVKEVPKSRISRDKMKALIKKRLRQSTELDLQSNPSDEVTPVSLILSSDDDDAPPPALPPDPAKRQDQQTHVFEAIETSSVAEALPTPLDPQSDQDDDSLSISEPIGNALTLHSSALAGALAHDTPQDAAAPEERSGANHDADSDTSPSSEHDPEERPSGQFGPVEATKRAMSLADFLRGDTASPTRGTQSPIHETMNTFMSRPKSVKHSALNPASDASGLQARSAGHTSPSSLAEATPAYEHALMEASLAEQASPLEEHTKPKVRPLDQGDLGAPFSPFSHASLALDESSAGFGIRERKKSATQSNPRPSLPHPAPESIPSHSRLVFPKLEEHTISTQIEAHVPELFESSVSTLWRLRVRESRGALDEPAHPEEPVQGRWRNWTHFNMEQGRIFAITQNEQMNYFATAGARRHVEVWSTQSGRIYQLPTSGRIVYTLASTPDGRVLVAGDDKGKIHMWLLPQVLTAPSLTSLGASILYGHVGPLSSLCTNSTGKLLLSGSLDGTARLWSLEDGACMAIYDHGGDPLSGVTFGPKGPITVSHHGILRLWDRRGIMIDQVEGFSPLTAVGCRRSSIYMTTSTGDVLRYAKGEALRIASHAGESNDLSINPQGALMTVGSDGMVQMHQKGELMTMNIGQDLSAIHALDRMVMIGTKRGTVEVLKLY